MEPITEIIAIGREILDGRVVDTNSSFLGEKLNLLGLCPRFAQRVDDEEARIIESFELAQKRSRIVLVCGGLGPTSDDLTIQTFAKFIGKPLQLNAEALSQIEERFRSMNRPFTDVQKKQALFPEGGTILPNRLGTAPSYTYTFNGVQWFFMPGVPKELKDIFTESVVPLLQKVSRTARSHTWYTQFTSEGELQKRLHDIISHAHKFGFEFTFRTRFPENHIGLIAVDPSPEKEMEFQKLQKQVSERLSSDVFSEGAVPEKLEQVLLTRASHKKCDLVTVESCTGGLVAERITRVPGASQNFWGSFVCYDNSAKIHLGVRKECLDKWGAVSEQTSLELAHQGAKVKNAAKPSLTLSVSTTGIAGPSGGSSQKPVGLCFTSVVILDPTGKTLFHATDQVQARTGLTREETTLFFSQKALSLALQALQNL